MEQSSSNPELPNYVTCEWLQDILRKAEKCEDLKVVKFVPSAGSGHGDNFVAIVIRVSVDAVKSGVPKTYSLIMKVMPKNTLRLEIAGTNALFEVEIEMYTKLIPELINYQKEKGVKNEFNAIPRCLHAVMDNKEPIIVLEDMNMLGYEMGDKKQGLGYKQCCLVMKALGHFHSLSLAMKADDKSRFDICKQNIKEMLFTDAKREMFDMYLKGTVKNSVNTLRNAGTDSKLVTYLENFGVDLFDKVQKLLEPREPTAVVNHGDCWFNNMMFLYDPEDNQHPTNVKLLDLQIARYGSPVLDLSYFFYTSTTEGLRRQHLDELLHMYHDTVVQSLRELGSDPSIFTYEIFMKEWRDFSVFGLVSAIQVLPIILAKKEDVPDLEALTEDDMNNGNIEEHWGKMLNDDYVDRMKGVLCDFVSGSLI